MYVCMCVYCVYDLERLPDVFMFSGSIYIKDTVLKPLSPLTTINQKWTFQIIFQPAKIKNEAQRNRIQDSNFC